MELLLTYIMYHLVSRGIIASPIPRHLRPLAPRVIQRVQCQVNALSVIKPNALACQKCTISLKD
uniref:Mobile element protein n=1 Tax=Ascaris lumbricoides TaxID=6252 RepID=A0A0M3HHW3_ASCLU